MKKFYALLLLLPLLFATSCSKDVLKSYDKRIVGTWKVIDIDRFGFNGADNLPFKEDDLFTFDNDGDVRYNRADQSYTGTWDIVRYNESEQEKKSLQITAIDFENEQVRSEYFNDMQFTSTNRFTAFINYNTRVYVYRFLRQ